MNLHSACEFPWKLATAEAEGSTVGRPPALLSPDFPHTASVRRYAAAFFCGRPMANTMDEPRSSRGLRAGGPSPRAHHLHAVHSAEEADRHAGHVAALLHAV